MLDGIDFMRFCIFLRHRIIYTVILLFFASRRQHTRLQGDWSSDVCSSDLTVAGNVYEFVEVEELEQNPDSPQAWRMIGVERSEERRVGKVCGTGWTEVGRTNRHRHIKTSIVMLAAANDEVDIMPGLN